MRTKYLYSRLSKRHDWGYGTPVDAEDWLNNLILTDCLSFRSWRNRSKYPDSQLGIVTQEFIPYGESSAPSNFEMDKTLSKEKAVELCKKELDDFVSTRDKIRENILPALLYSKQSPVVQKSGITNEQNTLLKKKMNDFIGCLNREGIFQ